MGNRFGNYPSFTAAQTAIEADGWVQCADREVFRKRGRPDPFFGSTERTYLVRIERQHVDPQYGADYYVHHYL